ncbi:arginyltransferase [Allopusillimonas soli]|uniref:Aspartate/glutamate leucyltransferase n=1 Tax=Allopusillimonas soli TaxID=659016 RepID=A0A853FGL5_9BURK|nr:arginyltransferase [Allopusillimonas soli]NYT39009.1 arginyltransferase [Allopusillimonas soli]TEA69551.1 arginyltransferase [Allopusillimonas soli]
MSHLTEPGFHTLQFYATALYPCSYLTGAQARSQVAAPTHLIDSRTYSGLVEQGFRRSGLFTYRPHCDACQACLPIRIDVRHFQPSRTQRRMWRRHSLLQARELPLLWKAEHYALYRAYQLGRHAGAGMDEDSHAQYTQFLLTSRVDSHLVEFRLPTGELQMVSMIDTLESGLSSVYTFFDPNAAGSLGTYGILWQIDRCRSKGLPWLYLGYWIEQSRKMAYKSQYRPAQIFKNGNWIDLATG